MELYYQGKDITENVQIRACTVKDTAGDRCDSLFVEFENPAIWYAWGPQEDDQIQVLHNGYDSGTMYVNRILPENGVYRIFATSLPCKARNKENRSFRNKTIEEIMRQCAMVSNMDYQIFGIDKNIVIPYIQQENEGPAAFLSKLLLLEGAYLKCINGKYTAIGIMYAQERAVSQSMEIIADQDGMQYWYAGSKNKSLSVKTPYACGTANDTDVADDHASAVICNLPALNNIQAARWARTRLLEFNRKCENLIIQSSFNAAATAMQRVDIEGNTDATGEWLIQEAEHDFVNLKTKITMHRCIWTIQ